MAGFARLAAGMLFGIHLREIDWLGQVRLMASWTQHRRVRQFGNHLGGIGNMLFLRSMTGLAVHPHMFAGVLDLDNVTMAVLAGFVARVVDGSGGNFRESIAPEMSVLTKAARHQRAAQPHEEKESRGKYCRQPEKMLRVLEPMHRESP